MQKLTLTQCEIMEKTLEALQKYDSPTICNALEKLKIRPLHEGFLPPLVVKLAGRGPYIGYASTAKYATASPLKQRVSNEGYYAHILATPRPSITVIEDVDRPPHSAIWGEVMTYSHAVMGSIALVTNGLVRDVDAVEAIGFGCFASGKSPSRAYLRLLEYNCPVKIGDTCIKPRDLLFCDHNGILIIPKEVLEDLVEVCEKIIRAEDSILEYCKTLLEDNKETDLETIMKYFKELAERRNL
jgi:regulator of RNase E activity RraA